MSGTTEALRKKYNELMQGDMNFVTIIRIGNIYAELKRRGCAPRPAPPFVKT